MRCPRFRPTLPVAQFAGGDQVVGARRQRRGRQPLDPVAGVRPRRLRRRPPQKCSPRPVSTLRTWQLPAERQRNAVLRAAVSFDVIAGALRQIGEDGRALPRATAAVAALVPSRRIAVLPLNAKRSPDDAPTATLLSRVGDRVGVRGDAFLGRRARVHANSKAAAGLRARQRTSPASIFRRSGAAGRTSAPPGSGGRVRLRRRSGAAVPCRPTTCWAAPWSATGVRPPKGSACARSKLVFRGMTASPASARDRLRRQCVGAGPGAARRRRRAGRGQGRLRTQDLAAGQPPVATGLIAVHPGDTVALVVEPGAGPSISAIASTGCCRSSCPANGHDRLARGRVGDRRIGLLAVRTASRRSARWARSPMLLAFAVAALQAPPDRPGRRRRRFAAVLSSGRRRGRAPPRHSVRRRQCRGALRQRSVRLATCAEGLDSAGPERSGLPSKTPPALAFDPAALGVEALTALERGRPCASCACAARRRPRRQPNSSCRHDGDVVHRAAIAFAPAQAAIGLGARRCRRPHDRTGRACRRSPVTATTARCTVGDRGSAFVLGSESGAVARSVHPSVHSIDHGRNAFGGPAFGAAGEPLRLILPLQVLPQPVDGNGGGQPPAGPPAPPRDGRRPAAAEFRAAAHDTTSRPVQKPVEVDKHAIAMGAGGRPLMA